MHPDDTSVRRGAADGGISITNYGPYRALLISPKGISPSLPLAISLSYPLGRLASCE